MKLTSTYKYADWKIRFLTATFVFPKEATDFTIDVVEGLIRNLTTVDSLEIAKGKKLGMHVVFASYVTVKQIREFVKELARITNCEAAYLRFFAPMYFGAKMTPFRVPVVLANWEKGALQMDIMTMRMFEMIDKLHPSDDPSCVLSTLMEAHTKDTAPLILQSQDFIATAASAEAYRVYEATMLVNAALTNAGIHVDEEKLEEALKPLIVEEKK